MNCTIEVAKSADQLDQVRSLMRAFTAWHKDRHSNDMTLVEAYFTKGRMRLNDRRMLRDTSIRQNEAKRLYEKQGFHEVEAYYNLPETLRNWLVFMERELL